MHTDLYGDLWGVPWGKLFLIKSTIDIRTYTDIFDRFAGTNGNYIVGNQWDVWGKMENVWHRKSNLESGYKF